MSQQASRQSRTSILIGAAVVASVVAFTAYWLTRRQEKRKRAPAIKISDEELLQLFEQTTETSRELTNLAHGDKLLLYGLYKQATVGDVSDDQEPSQFDVIGHAKYEGWLKFKGMPVEAAMRSYIQVVLEFKNAGTSMEYETQDLDMFNAMGNKPSTLIMESDHEPVDSTAVTPLLEAAQSGNVAHVKEALLVLEKDSTGDTTTVNTADASGQTALHFAADRGYSDIVIELLNAGADPNAADLEGIGVLQAAVIAGHANVASILLEKGADPQQPDMDGDTPTSCAQDDGSEEMKLLFANIT